MVTITINSNVGRTETLWHGLGTMTMLQAQALWMLFTDTGLFADTMIT